MQLFYPIPPVCVNNSCTHLQYPPQVGYKGNLLLDRLAGATIIICPPLKDLGNVIEKQIKLMEEYAVKLRYLILLTLARPSRVDR